MMVGVVATTAIKNNKNTSKTTVSPSAAKNAKIPVDSRCVPRQKWH